MSDATDKVAKLTVVADFLDRLTLGKVFLAVLGAVSGVIVYALFEDRAAWTPMLLQSPLLLGGLVIAAVLIAVGAAFNSLQTRLDQRTDSLYKQMRDQVIDMQRELDASRVERLELQRQIGQLQVAEGQCQVRVAELMRQLGRGLE